MWEKGELMGMGEGNRSPRVWVRGMVQWIIREERKGLHVPSFQLWFC